MDARDRTRVHALDGAVLLFQPSSGTSIRIETEATADVRRRAPRVVLFSLSHACNLDCGFCSRDASERARWSEEDAFRTLEALWRAGTLEVSFGGGEPLVHTGFVELLERLHAQTTLALSGHAPLAERLARGSTSGAAPASRASLSVSRTAADRARRSRGCRRACSSHRRSTPRWAHRRSRPLRGCRCRTACTRRYRSYS